MTDTFVTQCPHCQTRFRVNRLQLDAARGRVRCGTCLQVFNARQHLIGATAMDAAAPPAETAPASAPADAWQRDDLDLGDLDLDNLDLDAELAKLEALEHQQQQSAAASPEEPKRQPAETAREEPTLPPAGSLLIAPSGEDARHEPSLTLPQAPPDAEETAIQAEPVEASEPPAKPLLDLADEPLQLDWPKSPQPRTRRLGWTLLSLLAALALAGQYLWYHFDELARQDDYRPWLEAICPTLGCTLPPRVDIERIRSSNLVVRKHPEFGGALQVDAIIYNRASFAQPFPLLELRFTDLNGQVVASRRFKPSEYLGGELAGQTRMPPQTPIHIALEILDPGPQAMNYSLSFHSPE